MLILFNINLIKLCKVWLDTILIRGVKRTEGSSSSSDVHRFSHFTRKPSFLKGRSIKWYKHWVHTFHIVVPAFRCIGPIFKNYLFHFSLRLRYVNIKCSLISTQRMAAPLCLHTYAINFVHATSIPSQKSHVETSTDESWLEGG